MLTPTRVFARRRDGAIAPGTIKGVRYCHTNAIGYWVLFDDGCSEELQAWALFGPGFRTLIKAQPVPGLSVYVTYNQTLVQGQILLFYTEQNQVLLSFLTVSRGISTGVPILLS